MTTWNHISDIKGVHKLVRRGQKWEFLASVIAVKPLLTTNPPTLDKRPIFRAVVKFRFDEDGIRDTRLYALGTDFKAANAYKITRDLPEGKVFVYPDNGIERRREDIEQLEQTAPHVVPVIKEITANYFANFPGGDDDYLFELDDKPSLEKPEGCAITLRGNLRSYFAAMERESAFPINEKSAVFLNTDTSPTTGCAIVAGTYRIWEVKGP